MDVSTHTTEHEGRSVAYQSWGSGGLRFLILPEWTVVGSVSWEHPGVLRSWRRYASLGECARFDRPGIGASDPPDTPDVTFPAVWSGAASAVLDSLGWDDVILVSEGSAGQPVLLMASLDRRVSKVIVVNGFLRLTRTAPGDPGPSPEEFRSATDMTSQLWGTGHVLSVGAPNLAADEAFVGFCARNEDAACNPERAAIFARGMGAYDMSDIAGQVTQEALVIHTGDLPWVSVDHCRALVTALPHARLELLPSSTFYGDPRMSEVIQTFALGERMPSSRRRIAMMFTDIVGSTERVSALGDTRWRSILEDIDAFTDNEVRRLGGRIVTRTGDGCLAAFDDPVSAVQAAQSAARGAPMLGAAIRAGVHVGEVEVREDGDLAGLDVHIAARVAALADEGETLLSPTVVPALDSATKVRERGTHELKGVSGVWRLFGLDA